MKAVVVSRHGGPEVLEQTELPAPPAPGPGEVQVRVKAVSLNHLDLWVRRGHPGLHVELPFVPGSDLAGEVVSVGPDVAAWRPGDAVVAYPALFCGQCPACLAGRQNHCRGYAILGENAPGGLAERVNLPARNLVARPAGLSWAEAAAFPLAWLTSWHMLARKVDLLPGQWVLVQAAASGTGIAAVQIARLFGARVVATARGPQKCGRLAGMGADVVLDRTDPDLKAKVREITGGDGCAVVVDSLGSESFAQSMACLARGGSYLTCGGTTGPILQFDVRHLFIKHQRIMGSTMGDLSDFHALCGRMGPPPSPGEGLPRGLWPVVHRVFSWHEAAQAHEELESRRVVGKVVLVLEDARP